MKYPLLVVLPCLCPPRDPSVAIHAAASIGDGLADFMIVQRRAEQGLQQALNSLPCSLIAQYEAIGFIGDDIRIRTPHWDTLVMSHLQGTTRLVWGQDGVHNERLATHPFFSAHVACQIQLMAPPPPYRNLYDNFWWEIFGALGRRRYVPELITEHIHHCRGLRKHDEVDEPNTQTFDRDFADWPRFVREEIPKLVAKITVR